MKYDIIVPSTRARRARRPRRGRHWALLRSTYAREIFLPTPAQFPRAGMTRGFLCNNILSSEFFGELPNLQERSHARALLAPSPMFPVRYELFYGLFRHFVFILINVTFRNKFTTSVAVK